MAIVGAQEQDAGTVNLRDRDQKDPIGVFSIEKLLAHFKSLEPEKSPAYLEIQKKSYQLG